MFMKIRCRSYSTSKGFILISVLISVTLLLTSATAFSWFARNEIKRAEAISFIARSRSAAEIACLDASKKIAKDKNGYDSRSEPLYAYNGLTKSKIADFDLEVAIEPLDDKIPINGILLPDRVTLRSEYEVAWKRIWEYVGFPWLSAIVLDFIDADSSQKLQGGEREASINRELTDLAELRLINEIDDGVLLGTKDIPGGLSRYLTIYGKEKVNINTASPEVLAIMDERLDIAQARNFVAMRVMYPIKSLNDLKKIPGIPLNVITKLSNVISFESSYFRLKINVSYGDKKERNFRIILKRENDSCSVVRWEE
jgi:type II secretory pathway component PulK